MLTNYLTLKAHGEAALAYQTNPKDLMIQIIIEICFSDWDWYALSSHRLCHTNIIFLGNRKMQYIKPMRMFIIGIPTM